MARVQRQAAEWAGLIDQWRQSGLSLPEFCRQHGLSRGSMQNWVYKPELKRAVEEARREARGHGDKPPVSEPVSAFLPVRVAAAAALREASDGSGVEVVIGVGRRVVVEAGFDAETLRRVVAVLEGRTC